jgi:hypothetical protein
VMSQSDTDVFASSGAACERVAGREGVGADHRRRHSAIPTEEWAAVTCGDRNAATASRAAQLAVAHGKAALERSS